MITTHQQVTIDRCFSIITHQLWALSSLVEDTDEKNLEVLLGIIADCPISEPFAELAEKLGHWKKIVKGRIEKANEKAMREYLCVFGNWEKGANSYDNKIEILNFYNFTDETGYTEEDIKQIDALNIGLGWFSDLGNHYITRIK